jgi:hypothetical protein
VDATLQRTLIWAGYLLALALLGVWKPNLGRAAIGVFFLLMAVLVNIYTTVANPQSYAAWTDTALLPSTASSSCAWWRPTRRCWSCRWRPTRSRWPSPSS